MVTTELLTEGQPHTLVQNQMYALPAKSAKAFGSTAATFEMSNDGTTWKAVTMDTNNQFDAAATFIRATSVGAIISLKT